MTIKVIKNSSCSGIRNEVEKRAEVSLSACYQCKKCSAGCPVKNQVKSSPAEMIRRLQFGAGEEILNSDLIWICLSCETCYARCPNKINFAGIIDALRAMALEKGSAKPEGNMPLFNRQFLNTVKKYGRSYDLQMIALYKLGSGNLTGDIGKLPAMLKKGKISVLPPRGADMDKVKNIFSRLGKQQRKNK
jgi:heterodisulfide reductase subunit C2